MGRGLDKLEEKSRDSSDGTAISETELTDFLLAFRVLDQRGENFLNNPGSLVFMVTEYLCEIRQSMEMGAYSE